MTGEELLILWLKENINRSFTEKELQIELHEWQQKFGKYFLPDSLNRYFRFVRDKKLLEKDKLEIVVIRSGKYKTWKVMEIIKEPELF